MAFATYTDLEERWRPLTEEEQARATVLLGDAAVYLVNFVDIDPQDDTQAAALKIVSCSMVQRIMVASESDAFGIERQSIAADIYSQTVTYANPSGDFYLTSGERRLLGITGAYITSIRPAISPVKVVHHEDIWRDN